jgi:glycerol-3-phosphate dehydrogenase (NAD(P)+)
VGLKIGVIGAGSWGTTLSKLLSEKGNDVTVWSYTEGPCNDINEIKENRDFLPGIKLPDNLTADRDLISTCSGKDLILSISPSHTVKGLLEKVQDVIEERTLIVSASKGIENDTLRIMSEVFEEVLGSGRAKRVTYLSGPSFAREVSLKVPTAVSAACVDIDIAKKVQEIFSTNYFRVYSCTDVIGVELGGALKNVIAIAAGIADGLRFGHNTRAALITRGLAEISRLGVRMGAKPLTFLGLSGIGDLVLTCTGDLSRNRSVGLRIGQSEKLKDILDSMKMVAEGVKTSKAAYELSKIKDIDMPITKEVYLMLYEGKPPAESVKDLMGRDLKEEFIGI